MSDDIDAAHELALAMEREWALLQTIYNIYQSMRYYERENRVELPTIRMYAESVLGGLTQEMRAELHSQSVSAMVYDEAFGKDS